MCLLIFAPGAIIVLRRTVVDVTRRLHSLTSPPHLVLRTPENRLYLFFQPSEGKTGKNARPRFCPYAGESALGAPSRSIALAP